jgi:hypothetical protein
MDGGSEQRVAIKCCFKPGLSATETVILVQKAYGNEALNWSKVFRRYSRFGDRRELVEADERSGHPKLTWTEVNIAAVAADLVKNDRRIASRMIAETLNIPKTVVLWILKEDFGRRKFYLVARQCALPQSCKRLPIFDPSNFYDSLSPLYSPDVSPPDNFLFPKLKMKLKISMLRKVLRSNKP